MMVEGSVPIHHKKDNECQCQVQKQEYDTTVTIPFHFPGHILARLMGSGIACQRKPHDTQKTVIACQRAIPEGMVINTQTKLKHGINDIPYKATEQAHIHPQVDISYPDPHVLIPAFDALKKENDVGDSATPNGKCISRQHIGCNGNGMGFTQYHHAVNKKKDGDRQQNPQNGDMRKKQCFPNFL